MTTNHYSGDITLDGTENHPIRLGDPENVHIKQTAVDGDLKIVNAEFVFTNTEPGGNTSIGTPATDISGAIEDGYLEPDCGVGDILIENPDDVFIEHEAVTGSVEIVGAEQQFSDTSDSTPLSRHQYDDTVTGWQRSRSIDSPSEGVAVTGGQCTVEITGVDHDIEVYVSGFKNAVRVTGQSGTATVHVIGSHNTVETGPYVNIEQHTDTGIENSFESDAFPVDDVIQTSKSEAYSGLYIGQNKVTYQEPAPDQDYCQNCGADADAIIARKQEDAFFIFGYPIYKFDSGRGSYECNECAATVGQDVTLTESERKDIL